MVEKVEGKAEGSAEVGESLGGRKVEAGVEALDSVEVTVCGTRM